MFFSELSLETLDIPFRHCGSTTSFYITILHFNNAHARYIFIALLERCRGSVDHSLA